MTAYIINNKQILVIISNIIFFIIFQYFRLGELFFEVSLGPYNIKFTMILFSISFITYSLLKFVV